MHRHGHTRAEILKLQRNNKLHNKNLKAMLEVIKNQKRISYRKETGDRKAYGIFRDTKPITVLHRPFFEPKNKKHPSEPQLTKPAIISFDN